MLRRFPHYKQHDQYDCGPTCLKMIAKYYGVSIPMSRLRHISETTRTGTTLKGISDAAEKLGFRTIGVKVSFEKLAHEAPLPCIIHWEQNHFVVLYKVTKKAVYVSDPAHGLLKYDRADFLERWNGGEKNKKGVALLIEPTPDLQDIEEGEKRDKKGFFFLYRYLFRYKKFLTQLCIGLVAGSLLQLIFPFLTQSIVDVGIRNQDIGFIYLILAAQLFLFLGRTSIEVIRSWILLHLSTRINISLVSDFFIKLMSLPIAFFDTKVTGDILQRVQDHKRIENLLTTTSLNILFSMFNLLIFGAVLAWYSWTIFWLFLGGSILYFTWMTLFLKRRKDLDYKRFSHMSDEQSKVMELVNGMQEIKLNNAEKRKRWNWEYLQARLFKVETKNLALEQKQQVGSRFINELKNILIITFSAKFVIDGQMTLGMMLSVSYILGQLNSPLNQIIGFVHTAQDAKIALERLSEIHDREEEEGLGSDFIVDIPEEMDLRMEQVSFRYKGTSEPVLKGLDLTIPSGKTTAIVGASGSGKTTLMKMLLKFYAPDEGKLWLGKTDLGRIAPSEWRRKCGVVMQEGFLFNDTIVNNIVVGEDMVDKEKLNHAVEVANIKEMIEGLPLGYQTNIGQEGKGISTGQKQRILIARAVYKDPQYIFFDEATSALDANNERKIMKNLDAFILNRTAVVIAHRLSTVRNADQIVVLEKGRILEKGTHHELIQNKGVYYRLVKNQLELEKLDGESVKPEVNA